MANFHRHELTELDTIPNPVLRQRVRDAIPPSELPLDVVNVSGGRRVILADGRTYLVPPAGPATVAQPNWKQQTLARLNAGLGHNTERLHRVTVRTATGEVVATYTNAGADTATNRWTLVP